MHNRQTEAFGGEANPQFSASPHFHVTVDPKEYPLKQICFSAKKDSASKHIQNWMFTLVVLAGIAILDCTQTANADEYPSRPIHILLGTAAGGAADTVARLFAKELTSELKQTFIVENMPGAYAIRPMEAVARGAPDGYTFVLASSDIEWLPAIKRDYPFSIAKDFTPVAALTSSPMAFVVNEGLQVKSLKDFVGYAKNHANEVRYGTGGVGSPMHMAVELLELNGDSEWPISPIEAAQAKSRI